jgi:hypothetical protein
MSVAPNTEVPLWLLWAEALSVALSVAGIALHYNLRTLNRRRVKHAVVRFFVAAARENRLTRIRNAFASVERGLRTVYGHKVWRIVLISFLLSFFYFGAAFLASGAARVDWQRVRNIKANLEQTAQPVLYAVPAALRERATDINPCDEMTVCTYKYDDPEAQQIRAQITEFEQAYPRLLASSPEHTTLTMLTIWEGTYVEGTSFLVIFTLILLNILLDLVGVLLALKVTLLLSKKNSLFTMICLGILCTGVVLILGCISLYTYGMIDKGDSWGAASVIGFGIGLLVVLVGILELGVRSNSKPFDWFMRGLAVPTMIIAVFLMRSSWAHFVAFRVPSIVWDRPVGLFFYLVGLGTVFPSLVCAIFVIVLVLIGAFARTLLTPTVIYLRTVLRMPTPLLITLSAAPAILVSATIKLWPDLPRMLGHHMVR